MEANVVNNTSTLIPITFTKGAIKELQKLVEQKELTEEFGLRVGVEGGGCAGMNYVLGFDKKKEGDEEFYYEGVKVYLNKAHGMYLIGMEVDWQDGLNSRGFTFNNPNASSTCGCGTSFGV
ncbi:HesB/IscA family protein [Solitalea koreensis]|uniref:Iron-sulfur cluster assembly protein n=1 Tax=Solitalea koreensis TaxID=543615 RepID=A0A521CS91_9SPHI|nr:iron-sulfur cluster assembly accessory protein [Solitalea koreensis]SMO62337.1 iron-sulfur cluster assembly protein [Solitalea koreensis]